MKKAFNWFFSAFDTHSKGMSMRKFGAFSVIVVMIYLGIKFCTEYNVIEILSVYGAFALALLGIVTYQSVQEGKISVIAGKKDVNQGGETSSGQDAQ